MSDKVQIQRQNSRVVIITNSTNAESMLTTPENQAVIREQIFRETDVFCLMPTRVRCLCLVLTMLLIISLVAAIGNSVQSSKFKSTSFCKATWQSFGRDVVCPKETMFTYYECCPPLNDGDVPFCCARVKVWLIVAMISVTLSSVVGIIYTILKYVIRC